MVTVRASPKFDSMSRTSLADREQDYVSEKIYRSALY